MFSEKMPCIFRGRRSALDMATFILCVRRNTLDVSCCLFFANRIVGAVSSGDDVQTAWQAWDMRLSFCVADAAFGEDPSCVECGTSFFVTGAIFGAFSCLQLPLSALAWLREVRCYFRLSSAWQAQSLIMLQLATVDLTLPTSPHNIPHFRVLHWVCHIPLHVLPSHFALHTLHTPYFTLDI